MKLRNLLFGTMIACAFAACSNEDDPINGGDQPNVAEGEATLSVQVEGVKTKAAADEAITSLYVLVFKGTAESATLEKVGKAGAGTSVLKTPVTSGNKKVVVIANISDPTSDNSNGIKLVEGTTTYSAAIAGLTKSFTQAAQVEADGKLSMGSKVYNVTLTVGKDNCLGFAESTLTSDQALAVVENGNSATDAVKLYRNVAKITVAGMEFKAAAGNEGSSLVVKEVFLVHGKKMTKLVGAEGLEWGISEVANASTSFLYGESESYTEWVKRVQAAIGENGLPVFNYLADGVESYKDYLYNVTAEKLVTGAAFYAYENTSDDARTLLVVKGDYTREDVNKETKEFANRYYPIAVGVTGTITDNSSFNYGTAGRDKTIKGVLRNMQYNISAVLSGPGYDTPFGPKPGGEDPDQPVDPTQPDGDTFISVNCQVVPFGQVTQGGIEIE